MYFTGAHNLALHKPARQSTNYSETTYFAGAAVDGNRETFSHTQESRSVKWWMVNLGDRYGISNIVLYNRPGRGKLFNLWQ